MENAKQNAECQEYVQHSYCRLCPGSSCNLYKPSKAKRWRVQQAPWVAGANNQKASSCVVKRSKTPYCIDQCKKCKNTWMIEYLKVYFRHWFRNKHLGSMGSAWMKQFDPGPGSTKQENNIWASWLEKIPPSLFENGGLSCSVVRNRPVWGVPGYPKMDGLQWKILLK